MSKRNDMSERNRATEIDEDGERDKRERQNKITNKFSFVIAVYIYIYTFFAQEQISSCAVFNLCWRYTLFSLFVCCVECVLLVGYFSFFFIISFFLSLNSYLLLLVLLFRTKLSKTIMNCLSVCVRYIICMWIILWHKWV